MRNPVNWNVYSTTAQPTPLFGRGYTGHEQLNQFGLININARLYDPLLARFLAPDPFVNSGMTNDFNRYVYCRDNPLMFTDPTGESFWSDLWSSFKRDFKRTFLSGEGGFQVGWNSAGGGFINPTYNGAAFGPSVGISNSGQFTAGNSQGGFHNMNSIGQANRLNKAVVQAVQAARSEYYYIRSVADNYQNKINNWFENSLSAENLLGISSKNFEDVKVFRINSLGESGLTLPGVIFLGPESYDNINVLRHEYGHILQYRQWNISMSLRMIWNSVQSGRTYENNPREHMETWTEWSANKLAYDHFGKPSDWLLDSYIIFPTPISRKTLTAIVIV